ncbi:MAG TPA: RNA polymerase sigma factor [Burkholderiales bacterium]|nr:RNA polymerase sigma factor [Burkholderiales bacterium]
MPAFAPTETLPDSDAELARRVARGDTRAFEQVMRRYNRALFRTARAILRDDGLAEDAVQEAYIRAYGAIGGFRGESKLSTWLIRIVANEALERRRKDVRRAEVMPISGGAALDLERPMEEDGPQQMAERGEMRRLLEAKIDRLPDSYRAVFVLRALEELSVEETGAALGIPEATVRSRFFRARGLLREAISSEIDVAFDEAFGFAGERCDRIVAGVLARIAALT